MGKEFKFGQLTVEVIEGDITELERDAIVNAANSYLKHGGGVAAAIVRKGGVEIQQESDEYVKKHGPVPTGGVAVTGAGRLKAKYIIHAVGPVYGRDPEEKLAEAVENSLRKAEELGLKTIALPAISTGVYGFPMDKCAKIMREVLEAFSKETKLQKVTICLYGSEAYKNFLTAFSG